MLRYVVFVALLGVAFGQTFKPTPNNCTICHEIVGHAEHNIRNVTSQQQLQNILIQECHQMEKRDGPAGTLNCVGMVNDNIAKIYTDMKAGKHVGETCYDIGACTSVVTRSTTPNTPAPKAGAQRAAEMNLIGMRKQLLEKYKMRKSKPIVN